MSAEFYKSLRDAAREARRKHGIPCPVCVTKLPKAAPKILLPGQWCHGHHYRDPRPRTDENEYLTEVKR